MLNSVTAFGDDFWTTNELRNSSWNSMYTTPSGNQVHAQLRFNGDKGTYDTSFGQGKLSNIRYGIDTRSSPGRPFFQINGDWSFQGVTGKFIFTSNGRDKFNGSWQGNIGNGKWTGSAMYGAWRRDPNRDRYYCEYRYPSADNPVTINVQIVLWYANDPQRSNYYYFVNKKQQVWGRCVCPNSPSYDADAMQWSRLTNNNWIELPVGDCPAPADGDPQQAAINSIPDPPV